MYPIVPLIEEYREVTKLLNTYVETLPYYQAADRSHWDGEKDGIFGSRSGPYSRFIPAAVCNTSRAACPTPACRPAGAAR